MNLEYPSEARGMRSLRRIPTAKWPILLQQPTRQMMGGVATRTRGVVGEEAEVKVVEEVGGALSAMEIGERRRWAEENEGGR